MLQKLDKMRLHLQKISLIDVLPSGMLKDSSKIAS